MQWWPRSVCLAFYVAVLESMGAAVLTGPVTNTANAHVYYLLTPSTWSTAEAEAVDLGGHLVSVSDSEENAWVYSEFSLFEETPRALWIGLTDAAREGVWIWVNGDSSPYRNWAPGEPNNGGGFYPNEDHAVLMPPGSAYPSQWFDGPGDQLNHGVVEIAPPPPVLLAGPITNLMTGHIYYLLSPTNWAGAESIAGALGGHLATVEDAAENDWIFSQFSNYGGQERVLWLGLTDQQEEGNWKWISGSPASYRNWAPGEPNSGGGFFPDEDHMLMWNPSSGFPLGTWNDAPGTQIYNALVEVNPPQIVPTTIRHKVVTICWQSETNVFYQLQQRTSPNSDVWMDLGALTQGNGLEMCIPVEIQLGQASRFYRVLKF